MRYGSDSGSSLVELSVSASKLRVLDAEVPDGSRSKIQGTISGAVEDGGDSCDIGSALSGEEFVGLPLKQQNSSANATESPAAARAVADRD
jgi:hypothetical protein